MSILEAVTSKNSSPVYFMVTIITVMATFWMFDDRYAKSNEVTDLKQDLKESRNQIRDYVSQEMQRTVAEVKRFQLGLLQRKQFSGGTLTPFEKTQMLVLEAELANLSLVIQPPPIATFSLPELLLPLSKEDIGEPDLPPNIFGSGSEPALIENFGNHGTYTY